ncbi:hypothetical protein niasHT_007489 [Heterodera trifolii]|uniref:Uncharacterized protein n=1 Tax=Heterodera trifolii TaxID=157864 RepID=A0ABD2LPN5_9BILA
MPTAFVGAQRQQQMLGTILEEEWMDEELFSGAQNEEQRRPWHKKQQKANFGVKKTKGGGGREGGRVGKMVDWWMGRGDKWPNEAEEEEGQKRDKQQMVTLAKTTIQLSPPRERDGTKMTENGMDRDMKQQTFNNSNNSNSCAIAMPTDFIVGKSRTVPLKNGWNTPKAIEKTDQSKSEDRGNEVSVSLQVVREHNVTISASCCFGGAAEKKFPPLFAATTAHRGMPLSFCKNEKGRESGNRTPMGAEVRANDAAGDVMRKLELRMVDIELEEGEDEENGMEEEKRKWKRREWHDGVSGKRSRHQLDCEEEKEEEDKGGAVPTAAQPKQTTTGWAQFKRNREQQQRERREDGVFLPIRRLCAPQKSSSPYSCQTFASFPPNSSTAQSAVATNFARANSALPLLSPLCSPQTAPSWLNISNGSSSGVGSSVSSVSPKSTDGEGERDNGKNNGHKMEQFQQQQQFRRTTNSWTSRPHCTPCGGIVSASADYRVISLDMRPEPGRLEDFVPEVERERSKKAMDRTIGEFDNCIDTIKAKKTTTGEYAVASFTNAKTVVRENRNYDLQSVDCWRRWSSLRRMPTTTNAEKGRGGGGTLPSKKREGKRTEEVRKEGGEEDEALRRDEWGRLIVDRREWRQFLAEQRTPSSRRVESRIRLLDACNDSNNNSETDDGFEQYGKSGIRKKPMVIILDGAGKEEGQQKQQMLAYEEDKKLLRSATMNNGNCNGNGRTTTTTALLMRMKKEKGDKKWRQKLEEDEDEEEEEIWEGKAKQKKSIWKG